MSSPGRTSCSATGFALLGVGFVLYGWMRQRAVDRALAAGEYAAPSGAAVVVFTATGLVLGVGVLLVVLFAGD